MKILAITAGAAQMYCGSCIRDNALAAELKSQGHDVILLPIYTPTLTDEPNVSEDKVFFGGISVYLEQHSALLPQDPLAARPAVGFAVGAEAGLEALDRREPAAAGRDDDLHAARRGRPSAQGNRKAGQLAADASRRPIS